MNTLIRASASGRSEVVSVRRGGSRRLQVCGALLLLVFGGAWTQHVRAAQGAFVSQATIVLVAPAAEGSNVYTDPRIGDLILTGQVVEAAMGTAAMRSQVAKLGGSVPYEVALTNSGNQWVAIYNAPTLQASVTAPTSLRARSTMAAVTESVQLELAGLQRAAGAAPSQQIVAELSPRRPYLFHLGGRPSRATLGMVVLTLWAILAWLWITRPAQSRWRGGATDDTVQLAWPRVRRLGAHVERWWRPPAPTQS